MKNFKTFITQKRSTNRHSNQNSLNQYHTELKEIQKGRTFIHPKTLEIQNQSSLNFLQTGNKGVRL